MLVFVVVMAVMLWLMSRSSKKMQAKAAVERDEAVKIGNNVVTSSGFFGTIVDIDGDAVTLQTPSGDETVWLRRAISSVSELPLATASDSDLNADDLEDEDVSDSDVEKPSDDGEVNDSKRL